MKQRLGYLDSMRGIAASIVVLGHFARGLLTFITMAPFANMVLDRRPWLSPLILLEDADTAVCLFFVLSGFVLTKVFRSHIATAGATLAGRAVRLFVPGLCACIFGCLVFLITHVLTFREGGARFGHWGIFLKDAFISVPFLGYQGTSIFDHFPLIGPYVAPQRSAANAPLWSLSVEWQGSLLIFALVALRQSRRILWGAASLLLCLLFSRDWLIGFLFGHLAAIYSNAFQMRNWRRARRCIIAGMSLALGLFACLLAAADIVGPFNMLVAAHLPIPSCDDPTDAMRLYAAMLIFAGIFGLTELHRGLEHPALAWLGRMSFPIYLTHYPIVVWIVPLIFKEFPSWFWVPDPVTFAISPQIEYPRALITAFLAMIILTLAAATCFLAIDRFAISSGHKLRAYISSHCHRRRAEKRSAFGRFR